MAGSLLLCVFSPGAFREAATASQKVWICTIIMGIFSSAIAYVCWAKAFSLAPSASSVSNYMFLTPFLAAILGYFISGEIVTVRIMSGGIIILTGLFLFQKWNSKDNNNRSN